MNALCIGRSASLPTRLLGRRGVATSTVESAMDALGALERESFALSVLMASSGREGMEDYERLSRHPHAAEAIFVILTAAESADEALVALRLSLAERQAAHAAARRRLEQELRESEERFRRLSDVTMDGVILHDQGVVLDVNQALLQMLGYERSETMGARVARFVTNESLERILARARADEVYEATFVRKDGSTFPAEVRARLVPYAGRDVRVASVRDLTERRGAETAAVERSEKERFRQLSDASFEAIVVHDRGIIVDANEAFASMIGHPRSELVGAQALDFSSKETREIVKSNIESGSELPYEAVGVRKDGTTFPVEIRGRQIVYDGRELRVAALRDLTERNRMQHALRVTERLVSMGALAAGMGHEINNPLAYAMANLRLLSTRLVELGQTPSPEDRTLLAQVVDEAYEGCERIRVIVRDLQTFARAETDRRGPVDVHAVLDSCIRIVHHEIRYRARLTRDFGEVPHVTANEARLGQVFVNLLMNAAQAIEGVRPLDNEIRVSTRTAPDGRVIVEVSDTGKGIPFDIQGRIFDPFFTTKDVGVGTGIGLSISYSIVRSLGGELTFESTPGKGSVFRVVLEGTLLVPRKEHFAPPVQNGRRARILVVDDEPMIGVSLRAALEPSHEVQAETLARRALTRLTSGTESFDLILCDLMMPDVSGMDFFEELERAAPELAQRVVFVTGGAFTDRARAFVEKSGVRCFEKPFDLAALQEEIRKRTG